jgi:hypothetical protein
MSITPILKSIDTDNSSINERVVYKTQKITSASLGIYSFQFRSGSLSGSSNTQLNKSGSHWETLRTLFYASSSAIRDNSSEERIFRMADSVIVDLNPIKKQYLTKFYDSGSVFSIPQKYFGERIKPESFQLTDNHASKTVKIKDDGSGNLYSSNAYDSRSKASAISSSENYIGNIFYDFGIIAITETGSWSGSSASDAIKYTDIGRGKYNLKFDSVQTVHTHEYIVRIKPNEFNMTMNPTARSRAANGSILHTEAPNLLPKLTSSGWLPYFNSIALYSNNKQYYNSEKGINADIYEPVVLANLPRSIKRNQDTEIIFKIRFDI